MTSPAHTVSKIVEGSTGLFRRVLRGEAAPAPPIWLMRQAGRYHSHYRQLRARHRFETLCREPELAAEVAMGPIREFDFDAAILFSDLLFPLEALGFGLSYDEGPPKLDGSLTAERMARFRSLEEARAHLTFQREALSATRAQLSDEKGLLGFVGGPWTLFVYALEGTHAGALARAKASLDLYRDFADRMVPLLVENIRLQLEGGADAIMIFDTAAGELAPEVFHRAIARDLEVLARAFPNRLGYYAKGLRRAHLESSADGARLAFLDDLAGLGLDPRWDLAGALQHRPGPGFVQGNFDPALLQLTGGALERAIDAFLAPLAALDAEARRGWICGLGHGVLPSTDEDSVRTFVTRVRDQFTRSQGPKVPGS